ncbi:hypothetical protein [Effusibacillus consociatus]|uniref:Uncharacterized protein n=1 Tax=Effusibacillus consociatus TaxID=1117041 RepID=A0ABV9Q0R7_9BACL
MHQLWFDIVGSIAAALVLAGIPVFILHKYSRKEEERLQEKNQDR